MVGRAVNGEEIKKRKDPDPGIVAERFGAHAGNNKPGKDHEQERSCPQKGGAMTGVKVMALPQVALPLAESVEDAVGDIEQPSAECEKQRRLEKWQVKMHSAGKEP